MSEQSEETRPVVGGEKAGDDAPASPMAKAAAAPDVAAAAVSLAPAASPATDAGALPVVDAPAISPEPAAAQPETPVAAIAEDVAPSIVSDEGGETPAPAAPPNATQRFRAAAASQIAAARDRMAERNKAPVIAVALIAGLTGAAGQAGISAMMQNDQSVWQSRAIADAIAKLDDSISALRTDVERTAELTAAQVAATGVRLEKIEKAQAEPTAQIIKLSEAIEKLRATNALAAARAAAGDSASDVTGSIKSSSATPNPKSSKPAIVEGWSLKELDRDVALLESKDGLYETEVGDIIPGVGRVEGFRKQDGRWVVVTARGWIVSR